MRLFQWSLALSVWSSAVAALTEIRGDSRLGRHLLAHATLEGGRGLEEDVDLGFVAGFSLKFQGCHHVQQWNSNAQDEDDVRILTKRLVRFRLCPMDSCSYNKAAGCTSKYGDYVVDMNTFVEAYLEAMTDEKEEICQEATNDCAGECNGGDDADCMEACFDSFDLSFCVNQNYDQNNNNGFDIREYAQCANFNFRRMLGADSKRSLEDGVQYYIGPYCADQGGEIHLGLFTDDTCTTFSQNGESTFANFMGFELPYSDDSLVSNRCMPCGRQNDNGYYELKEMCENVYGASGKCETKMNVDYPNESSCSYIEGIKIIREDGVIRTSAIRKSKAAAVCIGLFLTVAVLLAGYVYYLRTKLGRAKINLAAASQSLT